MSDNIGMLSHCFLYIKDAEMASLLNSPDAFKLYDIAVKYVLASHFHVNL